MTTSRPDDRYPEPIQEWLTHAVEADASDLHLVAGRPPVLRIHGKLQTLQEPPLDGDVLWDLLSPLCSKETCDRFHREKDLDFSLALRLNGESQRFRVNFFLSGGQVGACFRVIPSTIPDFEWAGFPVPIAERLAHFRNGLVLISGVTGSGKTTTLAMIIDLLNREGGYRIITIEEPVEYAFSGISDSLVTQREIGEDVHTFADGLKYGLRQDPDVILVGEIRDRTTAQMALSAAETGHLVFSTLHAADAKGTISRYADFFPQDVQDEIRSQISITLRAVICQHLLPSIDEDHKRELALEILFNNTRIASAIRFGKMRSIDNNILTSRKDGMLNLDESIKRLFQAGKIGRDVAERFVCDPSYLS